jgi:two-component system chemotaxis response regulator CheY
MDENNGGRYMFSVAIVEDEKDLARMYQVILARTGIAVSFVASSGSEAIDRFKACDPKPRVVLMDNRLPQMSGIEATRVILDIEPDTRIIFLSADIGSRDEAIRAGAAIFVSKPARVSDIVGAIETAKAKRFTGGLLQRNGGDIPVGSW